MEYETILKFISERQLAERLIEHGFEDQVLIECENYHEFLAQVYYDKVVKPYIKEINEHNLEMTSYFRELISLTPFSLEAMQDEQTLKIYSLLNSITVMTCIHMIPRPENTRFDYIKSELLEIYDNIDEHVQWDEKIDGIRFLAAAMYWSWVSAELLENKYPTTIAKITELSNKITNKDCSIFRYTLY